MLVGGQQGSVLERLGKMGLGDSSWVILLLIMASGFSSCLLSCAPIRDIHRGLVLGGSRQHPSVGQQDTP